MWIVLGIGAFALGCAVGATVVYVMNVKKWHAREMDDVLGEMERTDENLERINGNIRLAVERFAEFADKLEKDMSLTRKDATAAAEAAKAGIESQSAGIESLAAAVGGIPDRFDRLDAACSEAKAVSDGIMERVKLLG